MARIVVELEIDGDAQNAYDVVDGALDAGVFQDQIAEFAADYDGQDLAVKRATVRLDDGLVFHAHSDGDPSVGIAPSGATIEIHGLDATPEMVNAARELLEEAFRTLFDDRRTRVLNVQEES